MCVFCRFFSSSPSLNTRAMVRNILERETFNFGYGNGLSIYSRERERERELAELRTNSIKNDEGRRIWSFAPFVGAIHPSVVQPQCGLALLLIFRSSIPRPFVIVFAPLPTVQLFAGGGRARSLKISQERFNRVLPPLFFVLGRFRTGPFV